MFEKDISNTKDSILKTAARLFSEKGYDKVTIREIAQDVGINPASLYYYFASKEELLNSLYEMYRTELIRGYPNLDELLSMIETSPPIDVLEKATFNFDDDKIEMLNQIQITAARRLGSDAASEEFIRLNIFDSIRNMFEPLLKRMIELGKIEPFDIYTFINVFSFYNFSAGVLTSTPFGHDLAEYYATMSWLYSVVLQVKDP